MNVKQLEAEDGSAEERTESETSRVRFLLTLLVDYLFFFSFTVIIIVFDVLQKLAIPFGLRRLEKVVRSFNICLVRSLRILGAKIEFERDFVPEIGKAYIAVCNHQSMFDIPILHVAFNQYRPKFIAKKELARWIPGISVCLRNEGAAVIDRNNSKQSALEIRRLGERMKRDAFVVVIFPEGTRARNGKIKKFYAAGLLVLTKTAPEAEVVPCAMSGSWRLNAGRFGHIPLGARITLRIGKPIRKLKGQELADETERVIGEMYHDLQSRRGGR